MTLALPCLVMMSRTEGSLLYQPAARLLRTLARNGGDVRQADHRAVHGFYHQRIVFIGVAQLVIDADGDGAFVAIEGAERAGGVGIGYRRADIFHGQAHGGQAGRIDAHADRRLLGAGDRNIGDAIDLRQPLRDYAVCGIIDGTRLHGLGGERQDQDRRRRGIGLPKCWKLRHVGRQVAKSGVERCLHVACSAFNAAAQVELYGDARLTERGNRGEFGNAGDLAQRAAPTGQRPSRP